MGELAGSRINQADLTRAQNDPSRLLHTKRLSEGGGSCMMTNWLLYFFFLSFFLGEKPPRGRRPAGKDPMGSLRVSV